MHDFANTIEQLRTLVVQHVGQESLASTVPLAAILLLLGGIGISILGAKLSRVALIGSFIAFGGIVGWQFGQTVQFAPALCAIAGGGMVGAIAHLTFRLWVGMIVAVVAAALAMGAFGYVRLVPFVDDFQQASLAPVAANSGETVFELPTPDEQTANLKRDIKDLGREFWTFATTQDSSIQRNAQMAGVGALLMGLFLGVVATRWALVLATSLLGTAFVTFGVVTGLSIVLPGSYQTLASHPKASAIVVGGFLLTSMVLQGMLTRKTPTASGNAES